MFNNDSIYWNQYAFNCLTFKQNNKLNLILNTQFAHVKTDTFAQIGICKHTQRDNPAGVAN